MGIPVTTTSTHAFPDKEYIPRGQNVLQALFKDHFAEFREIYDEKYAQIYGNYRTDRITEVVEEFLKCGDFREGVARIKCQNPKCGHDYAFPLGNECSAFLSWFLSLPVLSSETNTLVRRTDCTRRFIATPTQTVCVCNSKMPSSIFFTQPNLVFRYFPPDLQLDTRLL